MLHRAEFLPIVFHCVGEDVSRRYLVRAGVHSVVEQSASLRLQVSFGKDQTALVHEWQMVKAAG
jgi:hypothetical protein